MTIQRRQGGDVFVPLKQWIAGGWKCRERKYWGWKNVPALDITDEQPDSCHCYTSYRCRQHVVQCSYAGY